MVRTRQVAVITKSGRVQTITEEIPPLQTGAVLVEVHASLISPGTEFGGWRAFREKRDLRASGGGQPDGELSKFGYANAGVVKEVGEGAERFKPGDRVACMGHGHAYHTDYAVLPHHLCAPLPESVSYADGAYAHLAATALNAVRRGGSELGEFVAVAGLGIVGQFAAQLYRLAGAYVIGWEMIPLRLELARNCGVDAIARVGVDDEVEVTTQFTGGAGLDAAVVALGGDANSAMQSLIRCMKLSADGHRMGRVVVVGGARFQFASSPTNLDIRKSGRTGPGYHDASWEYGADYPSVFVRWSTRTNLELVIRYFEEAKLSVSPMTTHTVGLADIGEQLDEIVSDPDSVLGVVIDTRR